MTYILVVAFALLTGLIYFVDWLFILPMSEWTMEYTKKLDLKPHCIRISILECPNCAQKIKIPIPVHYEGTEREAQYLDYICNGCNLPMKRIS